LLSAAPLASVFSLVPWPVVERSPVFAGSLADALEFRSFFSELLAFKSSLPEFFVFRFSLPELLLFSSSFSDEPCPGR
jgi:hypothetical protein